MLLQWVRATIEWPLAFQALATLALLVVVVCAVLFWQAGHHVQESDLADDERVTAADGQDPRRGPASETS